MSTSPSQRARLASVTRVLGCTAALTLVGVATGASVLNLPGAQPAATTPAEGTSQLPAHQVDPHTGRQVADEFGPTLALPADAALNVAGFSATPGYFGLPAVTTHVTTNDKSSFPRGIRGADLSDVPAPAIAAYQRASMIVGAANTRCTIEWTTLAAVGLIASDHGRAGNGKLDTHGQRTPPLTGPPLTNTDGKRLPDTDGGRFDHDTRTDRATGPMMLPPATWAIVGVDADDDGSRNPQDIDDAALAAAVLMCTKPITTGAGTGNHRDARIAEAILAAARRYQSQAAESAEPGGAVVPDPGPAVPSPTQIRNVNATPAARATVSANATRHRWVSNYATAHTLVTPVPTSPGTAPPPHGTPWPCATGGSTPNSENTGTTPSPAEPSATPSMTASPTATPSAAAVCDDSPTAGTDPTSHQTPAPEQHR